MDLAAVDARLAEAVAKRSRLAAQFADEPDNLTLSVEITTEDKRIDRLLDARLRVAATAGPTVGPCPSPKAEPTPPGPRPT